MSKLNNIEARKVPSAEHHVSDFEGIGIPYRVA